MTTWKEFWNKKNDIYVSERHKEAHFSSGAEGAVALLPKRRPLRLLDWGCGAALGSRVFAESGVDLLLFDEVPFQREEAARRFSNTPGIHVLSAAEYETLENSSVDAILVNSVLQYLPKSDLESLLPKLKRLLKQEGLLILADIVPPEASVVDDVLALLRAGASHGFFLSALYGLVRTLFSNYRAIRREQGFTTYSEEEILTALRRSGFRGTRKPNIGFGSHRMLIEAVPENPS
jgi:ubiquinone/menaquinone biosynthesis C-methylase UbiE